jgi:hypothetical protein
VNVPITRYDLTVHGVRELPFGAWNHRAHCFAGVADGEYVARIVRRRHRVFDPSDAAKYQVAERNLLHHFRRHQVATQQTGDGRAIFFGDRREESQRVGTLGVPLAR